MMYLYLSMAMDPSQFLMQLAGLGGMEWIVVIGVIVAVFFGAKKIPEFARSFGRASGEYEKAKLEARKELNALKEGLMSSSSSSSSTISSSSPERTKMQEVAETLGINAQDKTDDQLRTAIQSELNRGKGRA
jgi:sec-independent protein translocase protein TatA